ncbi:hypothetical protein Tco_0471082 [Tanacetum coccineum]
MFSSSNWEKVVHPRRLHQSVPPFYSRSSVLRIHNCWVRVVIFFYGIDWFWRRSYNTVVKNIGCRNSADGSIGPQRTMDPQLMQYVFKKRKTFIDSVPFSPTPTTNIFKATDKLGSQLYSHLLMVMGNTLADRIWLEGRHTEGLTPHASTSGKVKITEIRMAELKSSSQREYKPLDQSKHLPSLPLLNPTARHLASPFSIARTMRDPKPPYTHLIESTLTKKELHPVG